MKLNVLDLFSGIGGFSLGLERTGGFETAAFCEIEPFCQKVLRKHWPNVPIHSDIRKLTGDTVGHVDVISGGFPCQDISSARGKDAVGIVGEKSGLWSEIARLIGECRPRYAIMENSSALVCRGLEHILCDLSALGYDAVWHCIPATAVGAPHQRDRIWIVAYPSTSRSVRTRWATEFSKEVATNLADANSDRFEKTQELWEWRTVTRGFYWHETEPDIRGVGDGVPNWSHRIMALGNAVVPQVVERIGQAILTANGDRT